MLVFALIALFAPALWHATTSRNVAGAAESLCHLRRRVPRFDPGPRDAEGVRPEQGARRQARDREAHEPVRAHHVGAGTNVLARGITDSAIACGAAAALALGAFRVEAGAMELSALLIILMLGDRDLPADARAAHGAAPGHGRHVGGPGPLPDPRRPAAGGGRAGAAACRSRSRRRIAFEGVRFRYPGTRRLVHDGLDFRVGAGRAHRHRRRVGRRQVVDRAAAAALLRSGRGRDPPRRPRPAPAFVRADPRA